MNHTDPQLHIQDSAGDLTDFGEKMARFPVEPQLAAILLAAGELQCALDAAELVALMSTDRGFLVPGNRCAPLELISFLRCRSYPLNDSGLTIHERFRF